MRILIDGRTPARGLRAPRLVAVVKPMSSSTTRPECGSGHADPDRLPNARTRPTSALPGRDGEAGVVIDHEAGGHRGTDGS